jgi:hypothetical protein
MALTFGGFLADRHGRSAIFLNQHCCSIKPDVGTGVPWRQQDSKAAARFSNDCRVSVLRSRSRRSDCILVPALAHAATHCSTAPASALVAAILNCTVARPTRTASVREFLSRQLSNDAPSKATAGNPSHQDAALAEGALR